MSLGCPPPPPPLPLQKKEGGGGVSVYHLSCEPPRTPIPTSPKHEPQWPWNWESNSLIHSRHQASSSEEEWAAQPFVRGRPPTLWPFVPIDCRLAVTFYSDKCHDAEGESGVYWKGVKFSQLLMSKCAGRLGPGGVIISRSRLYFIKEKLDLSSSLPLHFT